MKSRFLAVVMAVISGGAMAYNPGPPTNSGAIPGPASTLYLSKTAQHGGIVSGVYSNLVPNAAFSNKVAEIAGSASVTYSNTANSAWRGDWGASNTTRIVALENGYSLVLQSNVWAAADSTTNYAKRSIGRLSPIYGIGNAASDGGHAAINWLQTRLDIRSTNRLHDVVGIYANNSTGMLPNVSIPGIALWNYGETAAEPFAAGTRTASLSFGLHNATSAPAMWRIYGVASGTNDMVGDLLFTSQDQLSGIFERARITYDGGIVASGTVKAAKGFTLGTSNITDWSQIGGSGSGATGIVAGASDSYNPTTKTLTWNTNAAGGGGVTGDFVPTTGGTFAAEAQGVGFSFTSASDGIAAEGATMATTPADSSGNQGGGISLTSGNSGLYAGSILIRSGSSGASISIPARDINGNVGSSSGNIVLTVVDTGKVVIAGGSLLATNTVTAGNFVGNGASVTNVNVTTATGTLPAGVLGTNITRTIGGLVTTGTVSAAGHVVTGVQAGTNYTLTMFYDATNNIIKGVRAP